MTLTQTLGLFAGKGEHHGIQGKMDPKNIPGVSPESLCESGSKKWQRTANGGRRWPKAPRTARGRGKRRRLCQPPKSALRALSVVLRSLSWNIRPSFRHRGGSPCTPTFSPFPPPSLPAHPPLSVVQVAAGRPSEKRKASEKTRKASKRSRKRGWFRSGAFWVPSFAALAVGRGYVVPKNQLVARTIPLRKMDRSLNERGRLWDSGYRHLFVVPVLVIFDSNDSS